MDMYDLNCGEEFPFSKLLGEVLLACYRDKLDKSDRDVIYFVTKHGTFALYHYQACCEDVFIDDICGDLSDLIGEPILLAEAASNSDLPPPDGGSSSHTWTFYKISTIKGSVTIRWYGESNGCYSESVDFAFVANKEIEG